MKLPAAKKPISSYFRLYTIPTVLPSFTKSTKNYFNYFIILFIHLLTLTLDFVC